MERKEWVAICPTCYRKYRVWATSKEEAIKRTQREHDIDKGDRRFERFMKNCHPNCMSLTQPLEESFDGWRGM